MTDNDSWPIHNRRSGQPWRWTADTEYLHNGLSGG